MSIYCNPPVILFRVIHDGGPNLFPSTSFDQRGSLLPRDLSRPLTIEAIDEHLSWAHRATPLLSFCTWPTAVGWMQFLIQSRGATNVRIIAIDSSRLRDFIDGFAVAEALGYRGDACGDSCRQLAFHLGEYILHGWVQGELGERCQILAVMTFPGWPIILPNPGTGCFASPSDWNLCWWGSLIVDDLFRQIWEHTGYYDHEKLDRLILAMSHVWI